jgi:anti-sigma factor RsiW
MICPLQSEETELLLDYSAGRLKAAKRASVEQHMDTCARCAAFRIEQAAVWDALDLWDPAPVSMDFNRNLWHRIDDVATEPWYKQLAHSFRFGSWKPVLPLTAAVALIAAGFLLDHPGARDSEPGFTLNEAQQVEQTLDDIQLLHQMDAGGTTPDGNSKTM